MKATHIIIICIIVILSIITGIILREQAINNRVNSNVAIIKNQCIVINWTATDTEIEEGLAKFKIMRGNK